MWIYEKKLQYPVNIKQTNSRLAKAIITQYGGADCIRYDRVRLPALYLRFKIFTIGDICEI